ncbi:MAG TPA: porin [Thermoanaerobaculia bacterium]|nr:porin [Thermoanaerobaculia bacterium]
MRSFAAVLLVALFAATAGAQVTPAAATTPPDDTPSIKVGGTLFADYTYVDSPTTKDADGNVVHPSSFNVARAYINLTGQLFHRVSYRITPDIARESGTGSSLNGSQTFRLKYAFAQLNLDDWTTKGSFVRLGLQQTPLIDYQETVYRYRFQGPVFVDREGYLIASDNGLGGRWMIPNGYGEIYAGFYNGEGYSRTEANDEKAFQIRGTVRPLPLGGIWKGLRMSGFYDADNYLQDAKRTRAVADITFEHARANAGFIYMTAKDQSSSHNPTIDAKGWSAWVTPKLPHNFEVLARHDHLEPNTDTDQERDRNIFGVSYWVPTPKGVTAAVLLDYDSLEQKGFSTARPDDTRYGFHLLLNF